MIGFTTRFAGTGSAAWADGLGTSASFYNPTGIDVITNGMVYVADWLNQRIRRITSAGFASVLCVLEVSSCHSNIKVKVM